MLLLNFSSNEPNIVVSISGSVRTHSEMFTVVVKLLVEVWLLVVSGYRDTKKVVNYSVHFIQLVVSIKYGMLLRSKHFEVQALKRKQH